MKGYTGFKFGDARPSSPFSGGGSTFTGATPPSWLSGLSSFASPEEWKTQGTAFIQNPQMLQNRYQLEMIGSERERQKSFQPQQDELIRLGMESEKFGLEDLKKRREIEQTIERGPRAYEDERGRYLGPDKNYERAAQSLYGQQLLQQKRLGELGLQKAEFEGSLLSGGGFRASSGSMGSMGSMGQNSIPVGNSWMRSYQVPQFPTR
jgi:hypothetical protein